MTTTKASQRIPKVDLVVTWKLTGVGSRALSRVQTRRLSWQDARSGPAERYLPHASMHAMGEWPQFSDRTCVLIRTNIHLTVIPSNCSCSVTFCFLLSQLILDSVLVSAPGLGRLGSCAVCSGPQLYSRQPAHSLTSQKHPTLKNDPTFCVASICPRQNDRHAVEKSVKRWNMSVESCPIVLVCVLSDWQDCQVPLTNHLLPFQIGRNLRKK